MAVATRRVAYVCSPVVPSVDSAATSMTSDPASQPTKSRRRPATSSAIGTISASCGLRAIKDRTSPAAIGRLCRASHQEIEMTFRR